MVVDSACNLDGARHKRQNEILSGVAHLLAVALVIITPIVYTQWEMLGWLQCW